MQMIWRPEQALKVLASLPVDETEYDGAKTKRRKRRKLNHLNQTIARIRRGQFNGNSSY